MSPRQPIPATLAPPGAPPASPEEALRLVLEGTSGVTGRAFFRALVAHLAAALGFRFALIGEVQEDAPQRVRTLAVWAGDDHGPEMEYALPGTPCARITGEGYCEFLAGVRQRFPDDRELAEMGVEAYLGMPMFGASGRPVGLIALMDDRPRDRVGAHVEPILRVFAARAAAELERLRREAAQERILRSLRESEGRYQLLAHASPVGIFHVDPGGHCTYANPRCCEITGHPVEELSAHRWMEWIHPDDRAFVLEVRAAARAGGRTFAAEYRFLHADGRVVWVFGQSQPARDSAGNVLAWIGTLTDITESKRAIAALRQSERRYEALAERSAVGIWQVRPTGETLYINPSMREMLEVPPGDDLAGRTFHQYIAPESAGVMRAEHAQRPLGQSGAYEVDIVGARNGRRTVLLCGAPIVGPDGALESLIGTFVDVTDRKRVEQALRDTYASLRETNASLRESENRLRLLVDQTPAVLWTVDRAMKFTSSQGGALPSLGLRPQQVVGITLVDFFGTGDPGFPPLAAHRKALDGVSNTYELTWAGRLFHTTVEPLRGPDGSVVGAVGISVDITARLQAEDALRAANDLLESRVRERTAALERANAQLEEQVAERRRAEAALRDLNASLVRSEEHYREAAESKRLLLMELDHRVRNNVAGLISLVSLMRSRTRDVDAFAAAIEARLGAMAQVHDTLARGSFRPVDLATLVRDLTCASGALSNCPGGTCAQGPPVTISPRQTLPLSMVLLEWFTNSCKYGACSAADGRIRVTWDVIPTVANDGAPAKAVRLHWAESGGPTIRAPIVPSLGTELVESFATLELRGRCELRYPEQGASHTLEFALE